MGCRHGFPRAGPVQARCSQAWPITASSGISGISRLSRRDLLVDAGTPRLAGRSERIFTTHGLVQRHRDVRGHLDRTGRRRGAVHAGLPCLRAGDPRRGAEVTECPLTLRRRRHLRMDFDAYDALMTGRERMVILCSPHNPGGRVWTPGRIARRGRFRAAPRPAADVRRDPPRSGLPGARHTADALAAPDIADRLVMLTAPSKTFNIAGAHVGNVIIPDDPVRGWHSAPAWRPWACRPTRSGCTW